jgi:hypothetical protein
MVINIPIVEDASRHGVLVLRSAVFATRPIIIPVSQVVDVITGSYKAS